MLENFYYVLWLPLFRTVILEATLRPQSHGLLCPC